MKRLVLLGAWALLAQGCMAYHADRLPDAPQGATFLEIEGTHVHYIDRTPAQGATKGTAVLVHGFGASTGEWLGVIPKLEVAEKP